MYNISIYSDFIPAYFIYSNFHARFIIQPLFLYKLPATYNFPVKSFSLICNKFIRYEKFHFRHDGPSEASWLTWRVLTAYLQEVTGRHDASTGRWDASTSSRRARQVASTGHHDTSTGRRQKMRPSRCINKLSPHVNRPSSEDDGSVLMASLHGNSLRTAIGPGNLWYFFSQGSWRCKIYSKILYKI